MSDVNGTCPGDDTSNFDDVSQDIRKATLDKIEKFEKIRGKECTEPFWDLIVLSALDDAQKLAYETQLNEKLERKEIPSSPTYHVFHDPIGVKVGNGGGVIAVMDELEKMYKEKLKELKVLLLLSGGYSQRLPSASLLGKIYTPMPMGNPLYQMLELKLAMYIDFPKRMKPGVLVSSADCIELYELKGDEWNFNNPGFTSMAYPSPIEIGTTHGVHVLENPEEHVYDCKSKRSSSVARCRRFLHKPTKELMRDTKAVFIRNGDEYVHSDSNYYMDMTTALLLLDWYRKRGGVQCEIDAYGDFLQALGPDGTSDYCRNVKNVTVVLPSLVSTREEIFNLLRTTQHNVLVLHKSRFYHTGTTKEYIENFCIDKNFRFEMACSNQAMVKCARQNLVVKDSTMVAHTFVRSGLDVGENVVIEYCSLGYSNQIGNNCILSNNRFPDKVVVPAKSFIHTVVIRDEAQPLYVAVAFSIDDNLKKSAKTRSDASSLNYAGLPLDEALDKLYLFQDPWAEDCEIFNLWHAKMFPAFHQPEEAAQNAAKMLVACRSKRKYKCPAKKAIYSTFYSMADVLAMKDLKEVLAMRNKLRAEIEE